MLRTKAGHKPKAEGVLSQGTALVVVCKIDAQPCSIAWRGDLPRHTGFQNSGLMASSTCSKPTKG